MNPSKMNANRTARLAREASTPRYTSETGKPTQREREMAAQEARFHARKANFAWDECNCGDC